MLTTLAIGSPGDDTTGSNAGAVFIVLGSTLDGVGGPAVVAPNFTLTGEAEGDQFGASVDIAGDVDGAGADDVIVGAPYKGAGAYRAGKAYIFYASLATGTTGAADANVGLEGEADGDWAGENVASIGDVNSDGCDDVVIAAPNSGFVGANGGLSYLVYGCSLADGTAPIATAQARFMPSPGDYMGIGQAGPVGWLDFTGDGVADFLLASPYNVNGGGQSGAIFGFAGR